MENSELKQYVADSRSHGLSDDQIRQNLSSAGWQTADINEVMGGANVPVPHPPVSTAPKPKEHEDDYHLNMWIVFQYILMFMTLAVSSIALAGIAHNYITQSLGTTGTYNYGLFGSSLILEYLASLIVAFPIFAVMFIVLRKKIETNPEIRNIKSRKFFIYVALLWTFIVLLYRLVTVIYGFLAGSENTAASIAHLLVTILISGSIFFYFMMDVRKGVK